MNNNINLIAYFWTEKRDLTRSTDFNTDDLKKRYPSIYKAWKAYLNAEIAMTKAIDYELSQTEEDIDKMA